MNKEIIKPFDLDKAKAGAKLRTKVGYPVEIFKWDTRGDYPIKGMVKEEKRDNVESWTYRGSRYNNGESSLFDLVIVEEVEEPKFKVNDWITNSHIIVKVKELNENFYICENTMSAEWIVSNKDAETNYHLWTVKDAKAGDVLATKDSHICIFDNTVEEGKYPFAYCGLSIFGFEVYDRAMPFTHFDVYPATNKQRNLLFQKMKEAGYEWDAEKLELKKIKPKFWSDDKSNTFGGFFIDSCSDIEEITIVTNTETNYNVFATEKQAKSALAMARISQIMANDIENFGGVVTDEEWDNRNVVKYCICRKYNGIEVYINTKRYAFLAFHTEKQRDLFLEKYPQLVKDYLMI